MNFLTKNSSISGRAADTWYACPYKPNGEYHFHPIEMNWESRPETFRGIISKPGMSVFMSASPIASATHPPPAADAPRGQPCWPTAAEVASSAGGHGGSTSRYARCEPL